MPILAAAGATLLVKTGWLVFAQTPAFVLAILLSGWFGGKGPALVASVLSILAVDFYIVPPIGELAIEPAYLPGFAVFSLAALLVAWLSSAQHDFTKSLREIRDHLRAKVDELERANAALQAEIAARKQAEDELHRSRTELAHLNRVMTLGELAASIAHEISQPVSAVMTDAGAATRWLDARPPEANEVRQALARIQNSAARAADVIGRIRTLAKKSPVRMTDVDINETIASVVALTRNEFKPNRIILRLELQRGLLQVKGDRVQLQQVVLNLVMNAIDAMTGSETRQLLISSWQAGESVRVSVADSGYGLEQAGVEHLFDAFYTTKPAGMGMGLAICRSIVRAHGGSLSARANEPRGAVFEFELPLPQADAVAA